MPTFDDYLAAKLRLFTEVVRAGGVAVVNADAEHADAFHRRRADARACGSSPWAKRARHLKLVARSRVGDGQSLAHRLTRANTYDVELAAGRRFQASNALVAAGLAIGLGEDADNGLRRAGNI